MPKNTYRHTTVVRAVRANEKKNNNNVHIQSEEMKKSEWNEEINLFCHKYVPWDCTEMRKMNESTRMA